MYIHLTRYIFNLQYVLINDLSHNTIHLSGLNTLVPAFIVVIPVNMSTVQLFQLYCSHQDTKGCIIESWVLNKCFRMLEELKNLRIFYRGCVSFAATFIVNTQIYRFETKFLAIKIPLL